MPHTATDDHSREPPKRRPWGWWTLAVLVLVVVLLQYQNPHFLVSMADQLWGCF